MAAGSNAPTEPAIVAAGLTRRFGTLTAVNDVDFRLEHGQVLGLLGHNGAGKTTMVRLLNGILAPSAGGVRVLGLDPAADGPALRLRTGVLTEAPALHELLTVHENLAVHAKVAGMDPAAIDRRIHDLLVELDLEDIEQRRVRGLSAGLRQRTALARALLHEPEMLFLDEPTTNIDPVAALNVRAMIRELSREHGRTIVVCTHNLREAQESCDRVLIMDRGRVLAEGTPAELSEHVGHRTSLHVLTTPAGAEIARATLNGRAAIRVIDERVEITVSPLEPDETPQLVERFVRAGVPIHGVLERTPTLEDAYVALHEEQGVRVVRG